jgi:hypothetical protein
MIESLVVGFLYTRTLTVIVSFSFCIVTPRKLIMLSFSIPIVNIILGVNSLKESKTSCMFLIVSRCHQQSEVSNNVIVYYNVNCGIFNIL